MSQSNISRVTTAQIKTFTRTFLKPLFPADYKEIHKGTSLIRGRGPFLQSILLSPSRSGQLYVSPTYYVVGANPNEPGMHQGVSLHARNPRRWRFIGPDLSESFAVSLVKQMEDDTPLSFIAPLSDSAISAMFRDYAKQVRGRYYVPELFLAFFGMMRGAPTAATDLAHAERSFRWSSGLRFGKLSLGWRLREWFGQPLRDWETELDARFAVLKSRVGHTDCARMCWADAEQHCEKLSLPKLSWPSDWPRESELNRASAAGRAPSV